MTDDQILAELRRVARRAGSDTISYVDVGDRSSVIGNRVLVSRFGYFAAACTAAGLRQSIARPYRTEQQLADNLRCGRGHLGRRPSCSDLRRPPSTIKPGVYIYRYGSWSAAVDRLLSG